MKRISSLLVFLLLQASVAVAQTAIVTRNVNLRPDASSSGAPVDTLKTGTKLELVETDQTNGFLHVKTENGTEGWAWSHNLRVERNVPAASTQHVGPANLYPDPTMTPGLAATLSVDDLKKTYTDNCPNSKSSCTYSQDHRNVPSSVHKKVYDEYNVPQAQRNIKSGEVDHFYPLCAGGSNDISNLWYQPGLGEWNGKDFGYHTKDKLETYICVQIKAGKLDPKEAYDRITKDWVKFYLDEGLDK
jgi:SH3 domain-containing protein